MKLFASGKNYQLYEGSMTEMNDVIENEMIDAIVTDPPYELNFMGKGWDNAGISFQPSTWKHCYDVLKPGGYLLAFGGSRTFHRIACAIEDAGFEIRDTIMWLYGCYSSDTQVLTNKGWKYFYELDKTEKVLQWNKDTNELSWIKPLNYFEYEIEDELKLFENRHISQLVTKNHKVAVSVKERRKDYKKYQLIDADSIKKSWRLKFPMAGELEGSIKEKDAYLIGWYFTDAWKHKDGKAVMFSQCKTKTLSKLKDYLYSHNIKYSEYVKKSNNPNHKDEHIFYVTGEIADKLLSQYPDRELSWDMLNWDIDSRKALLEGLMDGDGSYRENVYSNTFWSQNSERCDIVQAICLSLNYRTYLCYKSGKLSGVIFNTAHNSTEIQNKHHKENVLYKGKVYCLETETGAFVVRRNGKAFISGNSGFPKSMNIGKAIEGKLTIGSANVKDIKKLDGVKTVVSSGIDKKNKELGYRDKEYGVIKTDVNYKTDIGKEWSGWGTALKPAFEPIIVARKPFKGTLVDNVLTYGVGGYNIDECRVGDEVVSIHSTPVGTFAGGEPNRGSDTNSYRDSVGRFPSNVILTYDDTDFKEVCGGFPITSSNGGSSSMPDLRDVGKKSKESIGVDKLSFGQVRNAERKETDYVSPLDSGSAARYFYCAKASKRDRDEGLYNEKQIVSDGRKKEIDNPYLRGMTPKHNSHPTVKGTDLMQYLVRLVAPKGSIILDPFNGSGSTGKAVMYENRDRDKDYTYIGIDLSEEYLAISKARIDFANGYEIEEIPKELVSSEDQLQMF